jgi:rifampin ADP-ribosylating transferase
MEFNPNNKVVKICLQGMGIEEKGKPGEAGKLFLQAWNEATNDFEQFLADHHVARLQKKVPGKLKWLETALQLALKINNEAIKSAFPSGYVFY